MSQFARFIALRSQAAAQKQFSRLILRIAVVAVALSVSIMILAGSMVAGFKSAISEKMFGFWGHIHIGSEVSPSAYSFESSPINLKQGFYPSLDSVRQIKLNLLDLETGQPYEERSRGGIDYVQAFGNKAGIIRTKEQIEGIVLRGLASDFHWAQLRPFLIEGDTLPSVISTQGEAQPILLSERSAQRLELKLGDEFPIYFAQGESSTAQRFYVHGIFRTGLEEYDARYALVPLASVQVLNGWRPFRFYGPELYLSLDTLLLYGHHEATSDEYWAHVKANLVQGEAFSLDDSASVCMVSERLAQQRGWALGQEIRLPFVDLESDTFYYKLKIASIFKAQLGSRLERMIFAPSLALQTPNQGLSPQVSGFEIFLENLEDLDAFGLYLNDEVLKGTRLYANTLKELEPGIFDWLELTDINEKVLTLLMMLVAIINMSTSMLILILERTNLIGLLKALGASDWNIRKIFLYHSAYILFRGLFWGNLIGLGLGYLQQRFRFIKLPEDLYYVSYAPIQVEWSHWLLVNLGTLGLTLLVMLLPTYWVSRIDPVKAIAYR